RLVGRDRAPRQRLEPPLLLREPRAQPRQPLALRLARPGRDERLQLGVHPAPRRDPRAAARAPPDVAAHDGLARGVELAVEPGGEVLVDRGAGGREIALAHVVPRSRRPAEPPPSEAPRSPSAAICSASAVRARCTSAFTERSVVSSSAATSA